MPSTSTSFRLQIFWNMSQVTFINKDVSENKYEQTKYQVQVSVSGNKYQVSKIKDQVIHFR